MNTIEKFAHLIMQFKWNKNCLIQSQIHGCQKIIIIKIPYFLHLTNKTFTIYHVYPVKNSGIVSYWVYLFIHIGNDTQYSFFTHIPSE